MKFDLYNFMLNKILNITVKLVFVTVCYTTGNQGLLIKKALNSVLVPFQSKIKIK